MSTTKKVAKSVIIMIVFSLGSKLLGFVREVLIASKYGSGMETDTYLVALTATSLIMSLIGVALNTTMIPILSEIESKEGKKGKIEHTNNILNIVLVCSILLVLFGWIISPIIIRILAKGFVGEQFDLAVKLMKIGLPVVVFSGVVNIFRGLLQSEMMFTESAASDFPFNFTYIFFLIFLSNKFGIKGLMITSVLAVGTQIIIQIPGIKKIGYTYKWKFDLSDKYIKKILFFMTPVLIGIAIDEVNIIVDRTLASWIGYT